MTDRKLCKKVESAIKEKYYCQEIAETGKAIADIYNQKAKLPDLSIESNIDDDVYENKNHELSSKLAKLKLECKEMTSLGNNQENAVTRLKEFR